MAAGTPILVYAPEGTALSKYANREGWGYVVLQNNMNALADAIKALYSDESLRRKIGTRAKEQARINHDADKVRENFKMVLSVIHQL